MAKNGEKLKFGYFSTEYGGRSDLFDGRSVAVVGLGYVGLPLCLLLSRSGFRVVGVDTDLRKVEAINTGNSPITDLENSDVAEMLDGGFRAFSTYDQVRGADAVMLALPTPLNREGQPDLDPLLSGVDSIAPPLENQCLVIVESTVGPGATEGEILPRLELHNKKLGVDFLLAFSPERVDPGSGHDVQTIPKIVSGIDQHSRDRASELYKSAGFNVVEAASTRDAEFAKLLENTYRAVNIALINELAEASESLRVDIAEAIRLASTKPFGFQPFYPSAGVGGHCIPIDPVYLEAALANAANHSKVLSSSIATNRSTPEVVARRISDVIDTQPNPSPAKPVLLLGMTYKPNVGDFREAPGLEIANHLNTMGHRVAYHDPFLSGPLPELDGRAEWHEKLPSPGDFEAVILIQNHSGFATLRESPADGTLLSAGARHGPFLSLWGAASSRGNSRPRQYRDPIDRPALYVQG